MISAPKSFVRTWFTISTRELQLPERITSLPKEYREEDLGRFFEACYDFERALFSTFLLTGFGEQEVMYLFWSDINRRRTGFRIGR